MNSILSAVVAATLALAAIEADAQATPGERQVSLTIESTSLATALDKWAQQSGFQIFVQDWEATKNLTAPSLKGTFSARAALEQLLEGTPLTYMWLNEKAVSIRKKTLQTVPTSLQRTGLEGQQSVPVAKLSGDGVGSSGILQSTQPTGSSEERATARPASIAEVVVLGTHIRGLENNTVPITVLDKGYIDSTGFATTDELVQSLPQNFGLTSQSGVNIPGTSGSRHQGTSINLRGVGEGTTLVLLNGRRLAPGQRSASVDVSALPLSAVERVEILTDGASALYGSDAVGGVVNFILKDDFDGVDTRLRSGWADGGVNEYRVSQVLGNAWDSGNALLSLEYYKRDLLPASARDFVPTDVDIGSLAPRERNYSAVLSGRQEISGDVDVFLDALYTKRDSYNRAGQTSFSQDASTDNPQFSGSFGLDWKVGGGWQVETGVSYARNKLNQVLDSQSIQPAEYESVFEIRGAQIKADGTLFALPGGDVRMAIGAEWRSESFREALVSRATGLSSGEMDSDQTVRSAFTEAYIPIFGPDNASTALRRLELSIAGRFDDYSTSGSSFDPQAGIMWEPLAGLRFRASYGTSYKAPNLVDYSVSTNSAAAFFVQNSGGTVFPGSPAGVFQMLQTTGSNPSEFAPQESESSSFGLEFVPDASPSLQFRLNYYTIRYTDQIATPPFAGVVLQNPAAFGELIIRDPTVGQVNQYIGYGELGFGFVPFNPDFSFPNTSFNPQDVDVIVDLRRRNLSVVRTSGWDASIQHTLSSAAGDFSIGVTGTYIAELEQQVTSGSDPFDTVDTIYNPPDWRVRGNLGWQNEEWSANLFVNHTDSYADNRTAVGLPVSSYTTVDARVSYDFTKRFPGGFLSGVTVAASAQNLLDKDPPHTAITALFRDMGFDPTNASPMGRFLAIEIMKAW